MAAVVCMCSAAATEPACSAGSISSDGSCNQFPTASAEGPPSWSLAPLQLPGHARAATSDQPLIIGASPGTTGTMSLYYALKALRVSVVHYTRQYNASSGVESTSYEHGGGPVPTAGHGEFTNTTFARFGDLGSSVLPRVPSGAV